MNRKIYFAVLSITVFLLAMAMCLNAYAKVPEYQKPKEEHIPIKEAFEVDAERLFVDWNTTLIEVSDEEIQMMARVVMSEASILDYDAKHLVAVTIVNRVKDGRWGKTVKEVIEYPNAYSTADNGTPTADCYEAVSQALRFESFPDDLYYFRTDKPHSFGYEYAHIGNTYFSTETEY